MKNLITVSLIAVGIVLSGCSSTSEHSVTQSYKNFRPVSLYSTLDNEHIQAKKLLNTAVIQIEQGDIEQAENTLSILRAQYHSRNSDLEIRLVTASMVNDLRNGEMAYFIGAIPELASVTRGIQRLPKQTQLIMAIAHVMAPNADIDVSVIDARILNWVNENKS